MTALVFALLLGPALAFQAANTKSQTNVRRDAFGGKKVSATFDPSTALGAQASSSASDLTNRDTLTAKHARRAVVESGIHVF